MMPTKTALVVIDVQQGLGVDGPEPAHEGPEVLRRIDSLLRKARDAGTPVIYVQHDGHESHPLAPGTPGWPIHPAVAPLAGEPVVRKRACDAFYETSLQDELIARGVTHLVVSGCVTEDCIDTTCRSALSHGFDVTLVGDAHTTWDWDWHDPPLSAAQIIAHHNTNLGHLIHPDHAIVVKRTAEVEF
jgi:nicotinamidase-related amidase